MPSKGFVNINAVMLRRRSERSLSKASAERGTLQAETEQELQRAVAQLERRVAELERRPGFEYRGVWSAKEVYKVGDFVTFKGGMWYAEEPSRDAQPGESEVWKLAVKAGRDRRDR